MTRARLILVIGLVVAVVGLPGCRHRSNDAVRTGDRAGTSEAPSSVENPTVVGPGNPSTNTAAGFCAPAKALDADLLAVGAARAPGDVESTVARARSAFTTARDAAPLNLVGDVDVLAVAYGEVFAGMKATGYDFTRLSVGVFSSLLTPEVKASSGRLRDFVNNDC